MKQVFQYVSNDRRTRGCVGPTHWTWGSSGITDILVIIILISYMYIVLAKIARAPHSFLWHTYGEKTGESNVLFCPPNVTHFNLTFFSARQSWDFFSQMAPKKQGRHLLVPRRTFFLNFKGLGRVPLGLYAKSKNITTSITSILIT